MSDTKSVVEEAQKQSKPIAPKVGALIERSKSVVLGTVDTEGNPNASYAPFVRIGNTFYILVSFMARHTNNLRNLKKVSVMFIEDETDTKQVYARERLTLDALALQVERDTEEWHAGIEKLRAVHGRILDILTGMDDFIMIALNPVKGAYVNGFGSAYFVNENLEVTEHRNDVAHSVKQ